MCLTVLIPITPGGGLPWTGVVAGMFKVLKPSGGSVDISVQLLCRK